MIAEGALGVFEELSGIAPPRTATPPVAASMHSVALLLSGWSEILRGPAEGRTFVAIPSLEDLPRWKVPAGSWMSLGGGSYFAHSLLGCRRMASVPGKHWDIGILDDAVVTWRSSVDECTEEESVADSTVRAFSTIKDVAEVYIDTGEDGMTVWVFIDGDEYDDGLMDRLLGEEVGVISRSPDQVMTFRYVPTARHLPHREVVGRDATLVFRRTANG